MNDYVKIAAICLLTVLCIMSYGTIRCNNSSFVDPLTFAFAPPPFDKYLDGWGLSHLAFFALLGYLFPSKIVFSFILGVLWELVEYSMKDRPFYLSSCQYTLKTQKGEGWWYGRWQDIVMNSVGLWIGYTIATQ